MSNSQPFCDFLCILLERSQNQNLCCRFPATYCRQNSCEDQEATAWTQKRSKQFDAIFENYLLSSFIHEGKQGTSVNCCSPFISFAHRAAAAGDFSWFWKEVSDMQNGNADHFCHQKHWQRQKKKVHLKVHWDTSTKNGSQTEKSLLRTSKMMIETGLKISAPMLTKLEV